MNFKVPSLEPKPFYNLMKLSGSTRGRGGRPPLGKDSHGTWPNCRERKGHKGREGTSQGNCIISTDSGEVFSHM